MVSEPPPYEMSTTPSSLSPSSPTPSHGQRHLGFPSGYFGIRCHAARRVWDVLGSKAENGTAVGLHADVKHPVYMRAGSLANSFNNQLFYLSWSGFLLSASAEKRIDIIDSSLSISSEFPISSTPTKASHPHPQFAFDPATSTIQALFTCDPTFPTETALLNWRDYDYLIESVPSSSLERASTGSGLLSKLFGAGSPTLSPSSDADDSEDDDINPWRELRVVRLHSSWREKFPPSLLADAVAGDSAQRKELKIWRRRQFSINPITRDRDEAKPRSSAVDRLSNGSSYAANPAPASASTTSDPTSNSNLSCGPRPLRLAASATIPVSPTKLASNQSTAPPPTPRPSQPTTNLTGWSSLLGIPLLRPRSGSFSSVSNSSRILASAPTSTISDAAVEERETLEREEYDEMEEFIPKSLGDYDDAREIQDVGSEFAVPESARPADIVEPEDNHEGNEQEATPTLTLTEGVEVGQGEVSNALEEPVIGPLRLATV